MQIQAGGGTEGQVLYVLDEDLSSDPAAIFTRVGSLHNAEDVQFSIPDEWVEQKRTPFVLVNKKLQEISPDYLEVSGKEKQAPAQEKTHCRQMNWSVSENKQTKEVSDTG